MLNQEEIDGLLLCYLLQELDEEKRSEVDKWIDSRDHRDYYREFCRSYIHLQWAVKDDAVRGEYKKFRRKFTRRQRLKMFVGMVAGIVLLIGVGIGLFRMMYSSRADLSDVVDNATIHAGTSQAILHLSSGEVIPIDTAYCKFEEQDGTSIEVHGNGSLNYKNDSIVNGDVELLNRLEVPRRGEFQLTLADGSRVWVNSGSELSYPSSFTSEERVVYLKGEAFFDVVHDDARPFIVKVENLEVKVYGTQFNVNTHRKGIVETVLVKGCVGLNSHGKETILKPEQKGEYNSIAQKIQVENVDVLPYIAWREGNFVFQSESLESVMDKLTLWYDLKVVYGGEEVKEVHLSGIMERYKDVNELFHFFEKTSELKFTVREDTVYIEKQNK